MMGVHLKGRVFTMSLWWEHIYDGSTSERESHHYVTIVGGYLEGILFIQQEMDGFS